MRKPIQISPCDDWLFALGDDGSIWRIHPSNQANQWARVLDIPQDPLSPVDYQTPPDGTYTIPK